MPCKGFLCDVTGLPVDPQECLACALAGGAGQGEQVCPFTPPLVRGLIAGTRPRGLPAYSATELLGCPRQVVLKERVDYWLAPRQAYWAFRGQLAHAILEAASDGEATICERRLYADAAGHLITGQPDVVYPARSLLVDYKTSKQVPQPRKRYTCPSCGHVLRANQWAARKGSRLTCRACGDVFVAGSEIDYELLPPAPYTQHVAQLNIYAWLLARNALPVSNAEVLYLDMSSPLRLAVPLWPLAKTEALIATCLERLAQSGPDGLPKGIQDDPDEKWRCRYCAVSAHCQQAQDLPV